MKIIPGEIEFTVEEYSRIKEILREDGKVVYILKTAKRRKTEIKAEEFEEMIREGFVLKEILKNLNVSRSKYLTFAQKRYGDHHFSKIRKLVI